MLSGLDLFVGFFCMTLFLDVISMVIYESLTGGMPGVRPWLLWCNGSYCFRIIAYCFDLNSLGSTIAIPWSSTFRVIISLIPIPNLISGPNFSSFWSFWKVHGLKLFLCSFHIWRERQFLISDYCSLVCLIRLSFIIPN